MSRKRVINERIALAAMLGDARMTISEPLLPDERSSVRRRRQQSLLIIASYATLLVQFMTLAMPAPFFSSSPQGASLGTQMGGMVFGAYPFGTVVAVALGIPPRLVSTIGVRATIALGVCLSAGTALCLGLAPGLIGKTSIAFVMLACRTVGGAGAAMAETGCLSALAVGGFGDSFGLVIGGVEVVIGCAMALGMLLGGTCYKIGASTVFGAFLFPYVVTACTPAVLLPLLYYAMPAHDGDHGADSGGNADGDGSGGGGGDGGSVGGSVGSGGVGSGSGSLSLSRSGSGSRSPSRSGRGSGSGSGGDGGGGGGGGSGGSSGTGASITHSPCEGGCGLNCRLWTAQRICTLATVVLWAAINDGPYRMLRRGSKCLYPAAVFAPNPNPNPTLTLTLTLTLTRSDPRPRAREAAHSVWCVTDRLCACRGLCCLHAGVATCRLRHGSAWRRALLQGSHGNGLVCVGDGLPAARTVSNRWWPCRLYCRRHGHTRTIFRPRSRNGAAPSRRPPGLSIQDVSGARVRVARGAIRPQPQKNSVACLVHCARRYPPCAICCLDWVTMLQTRRLYLPRGPVPSLSERCLGLSRARL